MDNHWKQNGWSWLHKTDRPLENITMNPKYKSVHRWEDINMPSCNYNILNPEVASSQRIGSNYSLTLYWTIKSEVRFSFVVPIHFQDKEWGEFVEVSITLFSVIIFSILVTTLFSKHLYHKEKFHDDHSLGLKGLRRVCNCSFCSGRETLLPNTVRFEKKTNDSRNWPMLLCSGGSRAGLAAASLRTRAI